MVAYQAFVRAELALSVVARLIVGAVLTTEVAQALTLLERPDLLRRSIYRNSFPSGHATVAFAVGSPATLVVPPVLAFERRRSSGPLRRGDRGRR